MALPKDDDGDLEKANQRDQEKLQELEGGGDGQTEEIEIEDPDDAEDEPGEQRPSRTEKRRNRYAEQKEAREAAERERDDLRTRLITLETIQRNQPQIREKQDSTPDPMDKAVEDNRKEQADIQAAFAKAIEEARAKDQSLPPSVVEDFRGRYQASLHKGQELVADRAAARAAAKSGGGGDTTKSAEVAALRMRYHDIANHPKGDQIAKWASGQWASHLAKGGGQSIEAMDRIMNDARREFGLAKAPPPSAATKARLAGASAGASGQTDTSPTSFAMTKADKDNARAAYPHLPEKQAFQKYIQVQIRPKRKAG